MYIPPYLPYLNFVENIIGFTDQAVAIGFFSHLMYCAFFVPKKLKVERLPRLMLMYMLNHLIFSCITIPYQGYMAIDWHVENAYNPYMIFWLGLTMNVYMVVTPLQVLFLTLDRCLILMFAEYYQERQKRLLFVVCLLCIFGFGAMVYVICLMELPLPLDKVKQCDSYPCLASKSKSLHVFYCKIIFGLLNVILGAVFFFALRKRNSKQIKNRIIKFTIMAEILFNVLPAWSSALFNNLFADNIANYLGQYVGMCATCDAVMCSIVYSAIFLRNGLSFSRVSTMSTVSQSWATSSVSNKGSRS
ncbi:DAF-16/FOXO Controlled, germline Tumor affecting [Ditylenchus destructor]|uniref:DAF-16/FOXO Controlled, germline Tumor affecting n=1 Tax=Ditylenchus destructor TaxID=166010 RepID=A0AAD4R974_9BILA|nr:DAF-16/FOXO Controlled, germline Tumor affecting [Ditylenchus destructor]